MIIVLLDRDQNGLNCVFAVMLLFITMVRFRKIVSSVRLRSSGPLARPNSHSRHKMYVNTSEALLIFFGWEYLTFS